MNERLIHRAGLSDREAQEAWLIIVDGVVVKDRLGHLDGKKIIIRNTPDPARKEETSLLGEVWAEWGSAPSYHKWLVRTMLPGLSNVMEAICKLVDNRLAHNLATTHRVRDGW